MLSWKVPLNTKLDLHKFLRSVLILTLFIYDEFQIFYNGDIVYSNIWGIVSIIRPGTRLLLIA